MKLRQKLAMVLASAMIVTAVPVTTMAASTNKLSNSMIMVEGTKVGFETRVNGVNSTSTDYTTVNYHPQLQLTMTDDVNINTDGGTTFYINAKDASFVKGAYYAAGQGASEKNGQWITLNADGKPVDANGVMDITPSFTFDVTQTDNTVATVKVTFLSADQVEVNVNSTAGKLAKNTTFAIPLFMTAKKGAPAVEVYAPHSAFSSSTAILLTSQTVGDKTLTAKVGDTPKITINGGDLATITVTENITEALKGKGHDADADTNAANIAARTVKIKLPNSSELEFAPSKITLTGKYGFAGQAVQLTSTGAFTKNSATGEFTVQQTTGVYEGCEFTVDGNELTLVLPAWAASGNTFGAIEISGVTVKPEDRNGAKIADVKATISGGMLADVTETVASVKEFDVEVKCEEPVALIGGKEAKKVKVEVNELVADVINTNDEVVLTLDEGWICELKVVTGGYQIPGVTVTSNGTTSPRTFEDLTEVRDYLVSEKAIEVSKHLSVKDLVLEQVDKNEYHVVGIEAKTVIDGDKKFNKDAANEMTVKMEIQAALGAKYSEINLKVENRGIEDQEVKVATVTQPATITAEGVTLKTGLKKQVGGKVVLKEAEKEMFARKGTITLSMVDEGIEVVDAKISVNGVRIKPKTETFGTGISFEIDRASDEAAEIVIEEIVFNTDRTVPEGGYDLVVSGTALKSADVCGEFKVEDFITISTKNTEDIQDAATVKEVVLAVGNTTYTVDGKEKTAAVAPFIDAQNRVMVPLRLVSEEFGANVDFGVLNGVGTVTIQKEGTTVQFQNKSKVMNKNGILVPMDTEAVIKEGTTYVPLRYLANALNIDLDWNPELKTVTFKN